MDTAVVLFTRDLRVRDNPVLHAASMTAERVVPLFVVDPRLDIPANRRRFLGESLADLRESLRRLGADLVIRQGDPVREVIGIAREVGADRVGVAADVSSYAAHRQERLAEACARGRLGFALFDALTVVPPGAVRPAGGGSHYRVFTPYWRAWQSYPARAEFPPPRRLRLPAGIDAGALPARLSATADPAGSPDVVPGGESAALRRLNQWRHVASDYTERHNDLPADGTSRLSPYLHFGCVSPVTVLSTVDSSEEFARQLCWRDFYQQVLHGFAALASEAYRPGAVEAWRTDAEALAAWQAGQTGVPIVDAGMRQLRAQGFMHNRARLITASFLTKRLGLDWREGMQWYARWLVDADVANNAGNWQWVAGTGTDTKPYRRFNPIRQAERFDPDGDYVRRWVPELSDLAGAAVHQPWRLAPRDIQRLRYPPPLGQEQDTAA